jgi:microcystin-dependent protein
VPTDVLALRDALDPVTVVFVQGLSTAMPQPGIPGRYFWANDIKVLFYDDGTQWFQPGAMSPGDLKPTAASAAPSGWLFCDGAQYARSDYAVLFNIIGLAWTGTDDGATFNVPDLRGRAPIGAGAGAGLSNRPLGQRGGWESHVLTAAEMPSHAHGVSDPTHAHGVNVVDNGHGHGGGVGGAAWAYRYVPGAGSATWGNLSAAGGTLYYAAGSGGAGVTTSDLNHTHSLSITPSGTGIQVGIYGAATGIGVQAAGGNGAHDNMTPFAAVNWLIKT